MDCKKLDNAKGCACASESCGNRGVCCDCLRFHLGRKSLPACMKNLDWLRVVGA